MLAKIRLTGIVSEAVVKQLEEFLGEEVDTRRIRLGTSIGVSSWEKLPEDELEPDKFLLENSNKEYITDANVFFTTFPELEISVKPIKMPRASVDDLANKIEALASKVENVLGNFDKDIQFNSKCDVHVPNLGLLNINELGYANDYCTESLQSRLDDGWRILAICPQPDQRRPDYILGRFVENSDGLRVHSF